MGRGAACGLRVWGICEDTHGKVSWLEKAFLHSLLGPDGPGVFVTSSGDSGVRVGAVSAALGSQLSRVFRGGVWITLRSCLLPSLVFFPPSAPPSSSSPAQLEKVCSPGARPVSWNSVQSPLHSGEQSPDAKALLFCGCVPEQPVKPDLAAPQHRGPFLDHLRAECNLPKPQLSLGRTSPG